MLDYRTIIIKRYALNLSGREIAKQIGASKSGVNEFLKSFEECNAISYPLPNHSMACIFTTSLQTELFQYQNISYKQHIDFPLIYQLCSDFHSVFRHFRRIQDKSPFLYLYNENLSYF